MTTGKRLALQEPQHDEDAHSWFNKKVEVCSTANGWDEAKKLLHLPTLLSLLLGGIRFLGKCKHGHVQPPEGGIPFPPELKH